MLCSPLIIPSLSSSSSYYSQFFHFFVFSLSQSHNTSLCKTLFSSYSIFFLFSNINSITSFLFSSCIGPFQTELESEKKKKFVTDACATGSTAAWHVRAYQIWVCQPTKLLQFGKCGMVAICVTFLQSTQIQHHLNFKKKLKLLEVTHVEIIKIKYPSMIALAKLIDSIEFLFFF